MFTQHLRAPAKLHLDSQKTTLPNISMRTKYQPFVVEPKYFCYFYADIISLSVLICWGFLKKIESCDFHVALLKAISCQQKNVAKIDTNDNLPSQCISFFAESSKMRAVWRYHDETQHCFFSSILGCFFQLFISTTPIASNQCILFFQFYQVSSPLSSILWISYRWCISVSLSFLIKITSARHLRKWPIFHHSLSFSLKMYSFRFVSTAICIWKCSPWFFLIGL